MLRAAATAFLALLLTTPPTATAAPTQVAASEVLVIQRPVRALRTHGLQPTATSPALRALLARHGLTRAHSIGPSRAGEEPAFLKLVSTRLDFDPWAAARELEASGLVAAAAPNARIELYSTFPNDSDLARQWHVHDPGDADIDLPEAWDLARGGSTVLIGIPDTGVDLGHPDLAGRIWTNPGEIAGNLIDDDLNGWVDDVHGYDVGDHDPDPTPTFYPGDYEDMSYHGTMVAGIAGAATDNAIGVAGADWNARIVPIKITTSPGYLTLEAITEAFRYAWTNHVDVLNLSFGAPGTGFRTFFQQLVDSARVSNVVCVAAVGNNGANDPPYPAGCDSILSVGATNRANQRASFSNWGPWVDVAAPGDSIWAPIQRAYVVDSISAAYYASQRGWDGARPYLYGNGTSFSAPLVVGLCAMIRGIAPGLDPLAVHQLVIASGDGVVYDHPIGPKVNAWRALATLLLTGVPERPERGAALVAGPRPFRDRVELSFHDPGDAPVRVEIFDLRGARVADATLPASPAGERRWVWQGHAVDGRAAPAGIYFARVRTRASVAVTRVVRVE